MSLHHKYNRKAITEINSGFGTNTADYGGRFINKNGEINVEKKGLNFIERNSIFHFMLSISRVNFFLLIMAFYIIVNIFFATIYYLAGTQYLVGLTASNEINKFTQAFFFSAQTFTTVGYGHISPSGFFVSAVAAAEALIGLLSLALATGLLYGRFSKPTAYLKFSTNAIIAPFKEDTALMFRIAPYKNISLTDVEAKLTLGMPVKDGENFKNKFFILDLEYSKINSLSLSWTIVHPINEDSPLLNFTKNDFANVKGELIIQIKAFDDLFSNTVIAKSSYTFSEIVYGVTFLPMYYREDKKNATILDLKKINDFKESKI